MVACYPQLEERSLLGPEPPSEPEERLDLVTEMLGRQILEHEPELRATLRLALESPRDPLPLRRGRAAAWIEDALAPLRGTLPDGDLRRLVLAIRAAVGIEPLVWLTDVGGLTREEAVELMRASARTLLRGALAEAGLR